MIRIKDMSIKYYNLPLNTRTLISRGVHETCSLEESISHHIHLISTSYFGECTFDDTFGCTIWIIDFDNLKTSNRLKSLVQASLYESLTRHEKRLHSIEVKEVETEVKAVEVKVSMKQEEIAGLEDSNRIKKRLDIRIKAKVKKTNEEFSYVEYFYIGPLSYS